MPRNFSLPKKTPVLNNNEAKKLLYSTNENTTFLKNHGPLCILPPVSDATVQRSREHSSFYTPYSIDRHVSTWVMSCLSLLSFALGSTKDGKTTARAPQPQVTHCLSLKRSIQPPPPTDGIEAPVPLRPADQQARRRTNQTTTGKPHHRPCRASLTTDPSRVRPYHPPRPLPSPIPTPAC